MKIVLPSKRTIPFSLQRPGPPFAQLVDGTGYAAACHKEMEGQPLTLSVREIKIKTLSTLAFPWSLRRKKEVTMKDLTPPGHHGPA